MRALALGIALLSACGSPAPVLRNAPATAEPPPAATTTEPLEEPAIDELPAPPPAVLLVTDPAVLARFDLPLSRFVSDLDRAAIREVVAGELRQLARDDERAGVGMRHAHRLFDVRWLDDPRARFELVGVVNRIDRRAFHPGTCGETRLVYRLAYRTDDIDSRLPMTVNVVFFQRGDAECGDAILRWQRAPEALGELGGALTHLDELKSIELDVEVVRWPGTVRPDLAGHAEYLLAVLRRGEDGALAPSPLENQPDVRRLSRDAAGRAALLDWIVEPSTLAAIETGTAVLPEALSARRASSAAPHGHARTANRPFSELVDEAELAARLPVLDGRLRTPAALLRRLDGLSCTGCHQSRSLAGFHLLGDEPADDRVDALALGRSPHLVGDLVRRAAYAEALAHGAAPPEHRGFPERDGHDGAGAHCGLGTDPSFETWTCADGLVCEPAGDAAIGVCGRRGVGDACEPVTVTRRRTDRGSHAELACALGTCQTNATGFPDGLCTAACGAEGTTCGAIPGLEPFNACIGRREPFAHCLATTSSPAALLACDEDHPCRDDYVCARAPGGEGGCIPPYFLFQLRVDGHPL